MIKTKQELKETLNYEKSIYDGYMGGGIYQKILRIIKAHPDYYTWKYVKILRITGYYYTKRKQNIVYAIMYLLYCRKKNKLGRKLGIELNEKNIGKGITIYHTQGIVINGTAEIGENLILHGNNCIGNNGITLESPKIGNNVRLGVGAKVIGNIEIADNIIVAAGAVVIKSCLEEGAVLAGIPARVVKNNKVL